MGVPFVYVIITISTLCSTLVSGGSIGRVPDLRASAKLSQGAFAGSRA